MWEKGTVKLTIPKPSTWCVCGYKDAWHPTEKCQIFQINPEFPWEDDLDRCQTNEPTAYLPHSCDEWVIGSKENVEGMIADLQAVLAKM